MKIFIILFFLFFSTLGWSQKKNINLHSSPSVLSKIVPNDPIDAWVLVRNEYATDKELMKAGKLSYLTQLAGFTFEPYSNGYYYIAYSKEGKVNYVTTLESLKSFVGKVDNGEEAVLLAATKGYIVDFEFKEYAANYTDLGKEYELNVGKKISEKCPIAKTHVQLLMRKQSGEILAEKDLGTYSEIYGKECKNNPQYAALAQQMEEAKRKAEEQKKIQNEINEKMRKRLEKQRRKD